jgi:hypothetical protein
VSLPFPIALSTLASDHFSILPTTELRLPILPRIFPNWETLASRRKLSRICALFKTHTGERLWKPIGDRLKPPHYLSRVDHERKFSSRRQRTYIGKYSFVNRTIQLWNQLPAVVLGNLPCKQITFKKRVRKAIIEFN